MSFCGKPFQCFAHGYDVVKDQQVSYEMVVLDELALLIAYAFGGQRAASEGDPLNELVEAFALFVCGLDQPPQLHIREIFE
jgi:hypothetical protein